MIDRSKVNKMVKKFADDVIYDMGVANVGVKAFVKSINEKTKEAVKEAQKAMNEYKEVHKQDNDGDHCCGCGHCHCEENHECNCGHCHCDEKKEEVEFVEPENEEKGE